MQDLCILDENTLTDKWHFLHCSFFNRWVPITTIPKGGLQIFSHQIGAPSGALIGCMTV